MQGAATVDDRPTTSGDDDDRIVMVKLLIALASLESNDKSLNTRIQFSLFEGHLTAHYLFKLDPMTVPVMKRITLHNLNLICWNTSNFSIDISSQQIPKHREF